MSEQRFETTTTVRRPRLALLYGVTALFIGLMVLSFILRAAHIPGGSGWTNLPWWALGPVLAAIQRRPKIETAAVFASPEGVRVNESLIPRAKLKSAMLRREAGRSFVLLRGRGGFGSSVDVAVSSDEEADRLCSALALDAKSTTAEFTLSQRATSLRGVLVFVAALTAAASAFAIALHHSLLPLVIMMAFLALLVVGLPLLIMSRRAKLLVGADGIAVKEGMKRRVFYRHDEIEGVSAHGTSVIIQRKHGPTMQFDVGAGESAKSKQRAELELQAQSIAWRIQKAREAYQALAGEAPQGALVLEQGQRTTHEWLEQLRRVGEGATATFRSVQLTREQLLRIVESTTASARERLAAAVALRAGLTEEEKPRVRVAADACALPALRERMVRVVDSSSDEELAAALEEQATELSAKT